MKRAIVLSGGGGKGSYQIGVWKALKKLHKKYDVVTGTSVGALNGAYMVQNDFQKAMDTWKNINYEMIFDDPLEIKSKKDILSFYAKGILKDKGMKIDQLEELVKNTIDEKKFRKSKIGYGLVTYNLTKLEPLVLKKEEIEEGRLCDYLIASASCFPVFQKKQIEENHYIDGGFYDNIPFELALQYKVDEIIVVDLLAPGVKRKWENNNVNLIWIKPNNRLNSFLSFNAEEAKRNICLGYNDTLKTFGKLEGHYFSFKKRQLNKVYRKYSHQFIDIINEVFQIYGQKKIIFEKLLSIEIFYNLLKNKDEINKKNVFFETMEYLGSCFQINEEQIYTIKQYHAKILEKSSEVTKENETERFIESKWKAIVYNKDRIVRMVKMLEKKDEKSKTDLCTLSLLYPKNFLAAVYLFMIKE